MSDVRAFRALRYARELGPRLAGPYDTIAPEERERLAAEPESIVHLTLPPGEEGERDYSAAAETLERWLRDGVLLRDETPSLYAYEQVALIAGEQRRRRGYFARLRLSPFEAREVLPHERTMAAPKAERLPRSRLIPARVSS